MKAAVVKEKKSDKKKTLNNKVENEKMEKFITNGREYKTSILVRILLGRMNLGDIHLVSPKALSWIEMIKFLQTTSIRYEVMKKHVELDLKKNKETQQYLAWRLGKVEEFIKRSEV